MKRISMVVLVVGLTLALAVPALAKRPGKPEPPDDPPDVAPCEAATLVAGSGGLEFECDWSPDATAGLAEGTISVEVVKGEISHLVLVVRDSSPGDICLLEGEWSELPLVAGDAVAASFPLVYEGEGYWDHPVHWCAQFDPVDGTREDLNGEPLHLLVSMRVKRDTRVEVTLTP